ncbi:MAG: DUF433 domain-containing protein [Balneolaceae bacterium]
MSIDTLNDHIETSENIAGGKPRIKGHRITVQNIVVWHEMLALSADEIATEYELSLADVYAALAYYHDHREQVDKSIHEEDAFVETLRKNFPSKVAKRMNE